MKQLISKALIKLAYIISRPHGRVYWNPEFKTRHEKDMSHHRVTEMFRDMWFNNVFDEDKIYGILENAGCGDSIYTMTLAEIFDTYFMKKRMMEWIFPGE